MGRLITIIRGAGIALLFLVIALCLAITIVPPFLDRIYYDGPVSRHYDGAHFFNPDGDITPPAPPGTSRSGFVARWLLGDDDRPAWPQAVAVKPSRPAPFAHSPQHGLSLSHATRSYLTTSSNSLLFPSDSPEEEEEEEGVPLPSDGTKRTEKPMSAVAK